MKTSYPFAHAALFLSALPLTSAWPTWPRWLPELDSLVVRQDSGSTAAPTPTTVPNLNTARPTTSRQTGTGSSSNSNSTETTAKPKPTEFDVTDPAGGISMITPAAILGTPLYKIGDYVTWGWNYTNLQATPTAIDILVSCKAATRTWTLTSNMTFATSGSYTWDTRVQQSAVESPLLTEQYTLIIYDSEAGMTATAAAGYLSVFNSWTFGMYTPRPYTPLDQWNCGACSAASSDLDRKALGFALTMSMLTVLSFTWFVTGLGLAW